MIALDASAVLALMQREHGADVVAARVGSAVMSTVNLAEVLGKLVDAGVDPTSVPTLLGSLGVRIEQFTVDDARLAAALREIPDARALSLGDRSCIALALRDDPAEAITADRAWADVAQHVKALRVTLIR